MITPDFLKLLDSICLNLGLSSRDEAANEILRWHSAFTPELVQLADTYLTTEQPDA